MEKHQFQNLDERILIFLAFAECPDSNAGNGIDSCSIQNSLKMYP